MVEAAADVMVDGAAAEVVVVAEVAAEAAAVVVEEVVSAVEETAGVEVVEAAQRSVTEEDSPTTLCSQNSCYSSRPVDSSARTGVRACLGSCELACVASCSPASHAVN